MWYVLAVAAFVVGCADDSNSTFTCHAPDQKSYSCQAIDPASATATSCMGGPVWRSAHGPDDAPLTHEDPDLVFPDGCALQLPECGCCYESGRSIICNRGQWQEPI
jgi:hypothetical protein